ncbi:MAG: DUF2878 domain-containing protein [Gammaproteobacteria bacterium]
MSGNLLNFMAFQLCWFANVLGAAQAMPWAGPVVTFAWLAAHFTALRGEARTEAWAIATAVTIGWLADSTLVLADLIAFPEQAQMGGPSPAWMVALWAGFAATLRHALGWLRGRWLLGAALGAAGGPLAYASGEALGALSLSGPAGLTAVAVQYALATPLLLAVVHVSERATATACCSAPPCIRP